MQLTVPKKVSLLLRTSTKAPRCSWKELSSAQRRGDAGGDDRVCGQWRQRRGKGVCGGCCGHLCPFERETLRYIVRVSVEDWHCSVHYG